MLLAKPTMRVLSDFTWILNRQDGPKRIMTVNREGIIQQIIIGSAREFSWDSFGGLVVAEESVGTCLTRYGPPIDNAEVIVNRPTRGWTGTGFVTGNRTAGGFSNLTPNVASYLANPGALESRTPIAWPSVYNSRRNSNDHIELVARKLELVDAGLRLGNHSLEATDSVIEMKSNWVEGVAKSLTNDIGITMRTRAHCYTVKVIAFARYI